MIIQSTPHPYLLFPSPSKHTRNFQGTSKLVGGGCMNENAIHGAPKKGVENGELH